MKYGEYEREIISKGKRWFGIGIAKEHQVEKPEYGFRERKVTLNQILSETIPKDYIAPIHVRENYLVYESRMNFEDI